MRKTLVFAIALGSLALSDQPPLSRAESDGDPRRAVPAYGFDGHFSCEFVPLDDGMPEAAGPDPPASTCFPSVNDDAE